MLLAIVIAKGKQVNARLVLNDRLCKRRVGKGRATWNIYAAL